MHQHRSSKTRSPLINVMASAAELAARKLVRDFGEVEHLQVSRKGPADFVTAADKRAEETLVYALQKARPNYGFLLEEGGEIAGSDSSNRWIIDPLDGTTNFLHGLAHFAISIGLERDGEPHAGLIYEPVHDRMFWAEKGTGAFLNGRRLRVSARKEMASALFATGIPFMGRDHDPAFMKQLQTVAANTAGVRRFGAAALDLAYVAAGSYEGFWESGLSPWDIAAGIVIVREAGGYVSDFDGGKTMMQSGSIVAANDQLHVPFLKMLKSAT